jgi:uncharacterized protein YndB with AHSA1/START domain
MTVSKSADHVLSRTFNAPRELVWQAWTQPKHVAQWWGPNGFIGVECKMDLRVGGQFDLNLQGPDGKHYPCMGTYLEIKAPERIVYEGPAGEGHPCGSGLPPRSLVTISFEATASKQTLLTIHTRFETETRRTAAMREGYETGWLQSLERLAATLH